METTAIYPNRIEDKKNLEPKLPEFGNEDTVFYRFDYIFATGYVRVVYGDHGPYIEFDKKHIKCKLNSKYSNNIDELPEFSKIYYYWLHPEKDYDLKVYLQIKPVSDLPNAPKRNDGRKSNFNRKEGYADYRRGMYYVAPDQLKWNNI